MSRLPDLASLALLALPAALALPLAACGPKEAPPGEATAGDMAPGGAEAAPADAGEAPAAEADPVELDEGAEADAPAPGVGTWHTLDCGADYARELIVGEDGTFTHLDLVSPCPPNARCMWSGVVTRQGTWTVQGPTLTLTAGGEPEGLGDGASVGMADLPELPTTVSLAHDGLKGADGCFYKRGPADRGFPARGERVRLPDSPK